MLGYVTQQAVAMRTRCPAKLRSDRRNFFRLDRQHNYGR